MSHPPLEARFGAAQLTLGLASGLRNAGAEVSMWSAASLLKAGRFEDVGLQRGRRLAEYLDEHAPFDVVDAPAEDLCFLEGCGATLVARSVQPDLQYGPLQVAAAIRRHPLGISTWVQAFQWPRRRRAILSGWDRAAVILCLGSLELSRMRSRFPHLSGRLAGYVASPLPERRELLLRVRGARRASMPAERRGRFLWVGRWTEQKGIHLLLSWMRESFGRDPAVRVTVAGCGEVRDRELLAWARRGRVTLVPEFDVTGLAEMLGSHEAGIFTSPVEGWGLSIQEMLEAGLPVYACGAGAVPDLKPYFADQLRQFPPEPGQWAKATVEVSPTLEEAYLQRFSWDTVGLEYLQQIERVRERKSWRPIAI